MVAAPTQAMNMLSDPSQGKRTPPRLKISLILLILSSFTSWNKSPDMWGQWENIIGEKPVQFGSYGKTQLSGKITPVAEVYPWPILREKTLLVNMWISVVMPKHVSSHKASFVAALLLMSCIFFLKMPSCFTDIKCTPHGALPYTWVGIHLFLWKSSQKKMRP